MAQPGHTWGSCIDKTWHYFSPDRGRRKMGCGDTFMDECVLQDDIAALAVPDSLVLSFCSYVKAWRESR